MSCGRSAVVVVFAVVLAAGAGCGDDFADIPLSLNQWDHGWRAAVEPGEEFDIGLAGSAAYPDAAWQIVAFDDSVIELAGREQADSGSAVPPVSAFFFTGTALGETSLDFELRVAGERIDVAEYSVAVVEDACDVERGATANRCGRDFTYHPQVLTELDHGQVVALAPATELDVMLTANALHPDAAWEVVEADAGVIAVEGPTHAAADRVEGDWGPWEPGERHSFLPTWTFHLTGVESGESRLVAEIRVDGELVDLYELVMTVE